MVFPTSLSLKLLLKLAVHPTRAIPNNNNKSCDTKPRSRLLICTHFIVNAILSEFTKVKFQILNEHASVDELAHEVAILGSCIF